MRTIKAMSAICGAQLIGIFIGTFCLVGPVLAGTPPPPDMNVPEPGTMSLVALGAIGIAVAARRRRK